MLIIIIITYLTIMLACIKVLIRELFMQKAILLFHISENLCIFTYFTLIDFKLANINSHVPTLLETNNFL